MCDGYLDLQRIRHCGTEKPEGDEQEAAFRERI